MRILATSLIALSLLGTTGCGSVISLRLGGPRVFGGVRCDCQLAYEIPFGVGLIFLLDLPFSLTFDTMVLPWTFAYSAEHGERPLETPFSHDYTGARSPRKVEIYLEGVVSQDSSPGYRVCTEREFLRTPSADWHSLANARFKVFSSLKDPPLSGISALPSSSTGYFLVHGGWEVPWEVIRVECDGFKSLEIPVSSLHSLTDESYWGEAHLLLIRLAPE
jgi:uncharacterized protein YceK